MRKESDVNKMTVDDFINSSIMFLEAYPATTISITYANNVKKGKVAKTGSENSVRVKCYDPHSGKCIKYKTYKSKELSKIMTFLGPQGVTVAKKGSDDKVCGLASVMSNKKFERDEDVKEVMDDKNVEVKDDKKKKKKKKGKK